jgi:hypothetical protein
MRLPSWYLNGVSLADLGFQPEPTEPGRRAGLTLLRQSLEVPGVAGELDAGFGARASARTIVMAGEVRGTDRAAVLEAIRTILAHAGRGLVDLRCVDASDRVIRVLRSDAAVAGVDAPSMLAEQRSGRLTLRFWAGEPAWRDVVPQQLAIGQVPVACPLGAGVPSPWTLEIFGSTAGVVTNPQVLYKDAAGNTVASLTLTGTLDWGTDATARYRLSTEGLVPRIRKMVAGVWTDDDSALTAGAFFALSPHDGFPSAGVYPSLQLFDAAGRATGLLTYTRRHEL